MLDAAIPSTRPFTHALDAVVEVPSPTVDIEPQASRRAGQRIADALALLGAKAAPKRRVVHAGERIYQAGERFANLYVLNSGFSSSSTSPPTAASRSSA